MRRPRGAFAASPRRTALESGIGAGCAVLLLAAVVAGVADPERRWSALTTGAAAVGIVAGFVAAIRRRRGGDGWPRREVAGVAAFGLAVWLGGTLALATIDLLDGRPGGYPVGAPTGPWLAPAVAGFAAVLAVGAHAAARGLALGWPVWDRRRRTRVLWALTHAQLSASLAVTLGIAALLTVAALVGVVGNAWWAAFDRSAGDGSVAGFVARVVEGAVPATLVFFAASLVLGVLVVAPVALISAAVLPGAVRRLEALAAATASLRAGDLAARVAVEGEDEIARLQADFNAMAADLERSLGDLAAERDAVARLLVNRRDLVAAVSHELRTPVATLRGYLDSTQNHWESDLPPALRDDLAVMAMETRRLEHLIDDLFTLSRIEVGRLPLAPQATDAGALIGRAVGVVAPLAWRRSRIEVVAEAAGLPPALVDADRLEQVVHNLLANAVRHTPPGGMVVIRARADGEALLVEVEDTGCGIPAADLPRVWERFYRSGDASDHDAGGAGLGLALVKELTEAMGGAVAAASTPGQGSCFSLRLPLAPAPR